MVVDAAKSSFSSAMSTHMNRLACAACDTPRYPRRTWYHRILGEKWFVKNVEVPFNRHVEEDRELIHIMEEALTLSYVAGYVNGYLESDKIDGRSVRSITRCGECDAVVHDSENFVKVWIDPLVLKMLVETETRVTCPKCEAPLTRAEICKRIDELLEEVIKKEEELR
jgi:hypothetical protein